MSDPTREQIEKLVVRAQRGDEKSFAKLFDAFYAKIFRYVSLRVNDNEVEDIVSDVFVKVVEHLPRYQPAKGAWFNSWIFRIAHNTVIDFYRKKKALLGKQVEGEEDFFLKIPDENRRPDEIVDHQYNSARLHAVLKELPANQREILELKYLNGFSNLEIAHITGKSEGNIRVIQLRALREIRKRWDS